MFLFDPTFFVTPTGTKGPTALVPGCRGPTALVPGCRGPLLHGYEVKSSLIRNVQITEYGFTVQDKVFNNF